MPVFGEQDQHAVPTGDTIATTYDNTDMPSAIALKNSTTTLQSFTYSDSPAGMVLSEADTPSSPKFPATYTYDAKGRVTSMTPGGGPTLNYTFDASSNLTTLPNGANATSGYDKAGELTSSTLSGTTTSYMYDADGERLTAKQGSTTIASGTWNGAGQLTSYSDGAANMTAATYDGTGLRSSIATGSGTQNFVWDTVSPITQTLMDTGNAYIYTGGVAPAEQVNLSTGTITYLVGDLLGSVRGTVSGSGALTGTASYDAWGNPASTGGLTATTPFGYAGGYTDSSGLIYLLARYYDPTTGQFISVDPAISQTLAPYGYADGNPVSRKDHSGLSTYVGVSWYGPTLYMSEWLVNRPWDLANFALFGSTGLRTYARQADKLIRTIGSVTIELDVHWVEVFCWEIAAIGWSLWLFDWWGHGVEITLLFWAPPNWVVVERRHG